MATSGTTSFRSFSPDFESLAERWRIDVVTADPWVEVPGNVTDDSEAEVFEVVYGTVRGFAKPGKKAPGVEKHPRAAHEKIASDLAYDLGLPVPPCILWERTNIDSEQERYCVISARPFSPVCSWADLSCYFSSLESVIRGPAAAMSPFDTWIGNADRNIGALLLQGIDSSRVAYVDHANALSHDWMNGEWRYKQPRKHFPEQMRTDIDAVREALRRIEDLPTKVIDEVVNRVPAPFLPSHRRAVILQGLHDRHRRIRAILKTLYRSL